MSESTDLIEQMIAQAPGWRGATFAELRKIILAADPEIIEEVKWRRPSNPLGAPVWSHNGIICVGNILKNSVRITFGSGASLPDPQKLFNTRLDSKTARGIDFFEGDKINGAAVRELVRAGVEYNLRKVKAGKGK